MLLTLPYLGSNPLQWKAANADEINDRENQHAKQCSRHCHDQELKESHTKQTELTGSLIYDILYNVGMVVWTYLRY